MARADRGTGPQRAEPAGLYVHLPFCARICPYCDFAVAVARPGERSRLVEALEREVELRALGFGGTIDSVYFGGGTPSAMDPGDVERLLERLDSAFDLAPGCHVSLEANPEDVSPSAVAAWRAMGVATLSLGLQSLDGEALRFLGRRHTPEQGTGAVRVARDAGFETVSLDLIYARPGQTVDTWRRELEQVAGLEPDHVSCYQLTVHATTPFGRLREKGRLEDPPESVRADLFVATHEHLGELGWPAYEVSNFARSPEHRSRHNLKYWTRAPYLGLGPSAHSFLDGRRWWNLADSRAYVERLERGESPLADGETLTPLQALTEEVMLGFRMAAGLDLAELEGRYRTDLLRRNRPLLEHWEASGWARLEDGRLRLSVSGLALADGLAARLDLGDEAGAPLRLEPASA